MESERECTLNWTHRFAQEKLVDLLRHINPRFLKCLRSCLQPELINISDISAQEKTFKKISTNPHFLKPLFSVTRRSRSDGSESLTE